MPFYKIIFGFSLLSLISFFSYSQSKPVLQATVDKNKILIGEPFQLSLQLTTGAGKPIRFISIDTIPHFEILEKGLIDTSTVNNIVVIKQVSRLTSFDSGRWLIPAFKLAGSPNIRSDTIGIDVGFAPFDRTKDYNDIKEIIAVPVQKEESNWYWYAAIAVVVALLIIYFLRKKKPKVVTPDSTIDPFKEAIHQLDNLKKENLPEKGEIKQYYIRLVDIFRLYVFRQKKIMSLQKTMDDLIIQVKLLKLSPEEYNKLAQALRLADFVKFAKYIPNAQDNQDAFTVIKNSIMTIHTNK